MKPRAKVDAILEHVLHDYPRPFKLDHVVQMAIQVTPQKELDLLMASSLRVQYRTRLSALLRQERDEFGLRKWGNYPDRFGETSRWWLHVNEMTIDQLASWVQMMEKHREGCERELSAAYKILELAEERGLNYVKDVREEALAEIV